MYSSQGQCILKKGRIIKYNSSFSYLIDQSISIENMLFSDLILEKEEFYKLCMRDEFNKVFTFINNNIEMKIHYLKINEDLSSLNISKKLYSEKYKTIFDEIPIGLLLHKKGIIIDYNKKYEELFGHRDEVLVGKSIYDFLPPNEIEKIQNMRKLRDKNLAPKSYFVLGEKSDGETFPSRVNAKRIRLNGEEFTLTHIEDITDIDKISELNKKNYMRFVESEKRFKKLFNILPIGISLFKNRYLIECNQEFLSIFGYIDMMEVVGQHAEKFISISDREKQNERYVNRIKGHLYKYSFKAIKKDGIKFKVKVISIDVTIEGKLHTLAIIEDLTELIKNEIEREKLQNQLIASHKLESLGLFSSQISHDFNNLLMVISGGLELLTGENKNKEELLILENLTNTCNQASNLVRQLLIYTGSVDLKPEIFSLSENIEKIKSMIRLSIPNSIFLEYNLYQGNLYVEMDKTQFIQMVLNFVINSAEASNNNGKITITTEIIDLTRTYTFKGLIISEKDIKSQKYALLSIVDYGIGIPSDRILKIFDPFFSSKEDGRGLGLSVIQGIVFYHRGFLEVISIEGSGTKFNVYIPLTNKISIPNYDDMKDKSKKILSGKVLICDDEPAILMIIGLMLNKIGLEVITAENGALGLELYRANKSSIALVILDLSMPVLDGIETFKQLRKEDKNLPIIVSSGYAQGKLDAIEDNNINFLQKPYKNKELVNLIDKLLRK